MAWDKEIDEIARKRELATATFLRHEEKGILREVAYELSRRGAEWRST